ncbi:MAG: 50S ribosomal protein L18 [Patescibacteria group bacterium]
MDSRKQKILKRTRKHARIRSRVKGTPARPRLSVFVSNRYMYAQIIDDEAMKTLVAANSKEIKTGTMLQKAQEVGRLIAKKAKEHKLEKVVFDRGGFLYSGKVKAIADAARGGGLIF